jgi:hypothetical protein
LGLGLTAATLIFICLPGVVLAVVLRVPENDHGPRVIADMGWKLVLVVLFGVIVVHIFLVGILSLLPRTVFPGPDLVIVGLLLAPSDSELVLEALQNVHANFLWISAYLVLACVIAALGYYGRRVFPPSRNWLDAKIEELMSGPGENSILYISIATKIDQDTWILGGIYEKHENNSKGLPEILYIQSPRRKRLSDEDIEENWQEIQGEGFAFNMNNGWHSLNLDWFALDKASDSD